MTIRNISAIFLLFGIFLTALYLLIIPEEKHEPVNFETISFQDLDGWQEDDLGKALEAFQISCGRLLDFPDERSFGAFGSALDWKSICRASLEIDPVAARRFFENRFTALKFTLEAPGLFTGYYAPLYKGSRVKSDKFSAPLYMVPEDLQNIDLGDFDESLKGRSIIGEVRENKFVPYKDREAIDRGALENKGLELVWLEKPEESFFLQIQGSGFIELEDGEIFHVGYAERNGRPYRAIGRFLIDSGDIAREDMSLQAIRRWMDENPEKSKQLMWKNPSYVFFRKRDGDKPVGSLGVGLTPGRSLAVDRSYIPLGVPLWLQTYQEMSSDEGKIIKIPDLNRLVVAQDTGGAIKGKIRGDVYWGIGDLAELKAGPMKDMGTYYILVPKSLVPSLLEGSTGDPL
ncbi:MAG: MltA domain-containing protein [Emcibacteraceae bacterium]